MIPSNWLPADRALDIEHRDPVPHEEQVDVVATAANWRFRGVTVEVGKRYRLPVSDAGVLVARGRAKFA